MDNQKTELPDNAGVPSDQKELEKTARDLRKNLEDRIEAFRACDRITEEDFKLIVH